MSTAPRSDPPRPDIDASPAALERERLALSLLRRAGRRSSPPQEASDRVHAAMLEVWANEVQRRRRLSRRLAVAAGVAVATACAAIWFWQLRLAPVNVAKVTRLTAEAVVTRHDAAQRITEKFELQTGDRLDVPAGSALGAQRPDGSSVRVAGPASLLWQSRERIRLDRGRVYIDMGAHPHPDAPTFAILTPLARIEHVGTRFAAEASPQRVRIAVRDGLVRVTSANGSALGLGGGQAVEAAVNGEMTWVTPPARTDWDWADALAPPCGIEGRSLFDVLTDLAREADLQLVFASPDIERRARGLTLHGPALALPPRTAIDAVLAATDLDADLSARRVVLRDRTTTGT
jgi:FecR protein